MNRVVVVGSSGSGKSTLARALAEARGWTLLELDSVYHQTDWTPLPEAELRARVAAFVAEREAWVVDGNYRAVREVLWSAADTLVWLDLPSWRVMSQLTWRTAARAVSRTPLWNGNRESWSNFTRFWDPEASVLAWSWTRHARYRSEYADLQRTPRWAHLRWVRLRSRGEVRAFLCESGLGKAVPTE